MSGLTLDPERLTLLQNGETTSLPPKEFALLYLLAANAGRVLTRQTIIDRVWGVDYFGDTKTLDVHVKRLRSRIESEPVGARSPQDGARGGLHARSPRLRRPERIHRTFTQRSRPPAATVTSPP